MKINFTQLSNTNHFGITLCPWYKYVSLKETRKCYKPTQLIRANNFFTHKILSSCKENKKAKSVLLKWNMTIYSLSLQSSTSSNQSRIFWKIEFLLYEDSQYTGVWKIGNTAVYMKYLSKYRLYTNMLRIHLFSIFTIKTPPALAELVPLDL